MSALDEIVVLARQGRFTEALARLDRLSLAPDERTKADVVRAELLERLGRVDDSRQALERLRRAPLTQADEGARAFVEGQIAWETGGNAEQAIEHVQRAVALARHAGDLRRLCRAQLRLMVMLAESAGPASVASLLGELRWNVVKLGDPHVTAALHVMLGETEAKRGLLATAARHTTLGQRLLQTSAPNPWLEGLAENTWVALDIMQSDFRSGLGHARLALTLAEQSGAAALRRAVLANLGNLLYLQGDFDRAVAHWREALATLPSSGERSHATLESLAALYSAQGRFDAAEAILREIDAEVRTEAATRLYGNRHARLALARLRARQGATAEAFRLIDGVVYVAARTGDRLLEAQALLTRAELLGAGGATREALDILHDLASSMLALPIDLRARYECALETCAAATGVSPLPADGYVGRARRIWTGLRNVPALLDAARTFGTRWDDALTAVPTTDLVRAGGVRATLQDVSLLLQQVGQPRLTAVAAVELLRAADAVADVRATARSADGGTEVLAAHRASLDAGDRGVLAVRACEVGVAAGARIEIAVQPWCDVDSVATVNAVTLVLDVVRALERAAAEREDHHTLWPTDELSGELSDAVIAGRMKSVVTAARRVAPSSAGVLITGESGTGKELVAREVHRASARAQLSFVVFNCSSGPRELVESQLFGYRRGAFTGADRDHPGLIRTAHGGTLFLDEVGDLPLDVQPKLLRFLELGEIAPLGETRVVRVDTRIVAATNADLESMVQDGRFRSDLYYRLNILPLRIPPLRERRDEIPALAHHFIAKAAVEFSKTALRVADDLLEHLVLYRWPGNVRQLNNELRRVVALAESGQTLTAAALSPEIRRAAAPVPGSGRAVSVPLGTKLTAALAGVERELIRTALGEHGGHVAQTAKALGISRKGLYLKRQRFGL